MNLEFLKIATEVGMGGLVVWLVVWIFRKTIPTLVQNFREELRIERAAMEKAAENCHAHGKEVTAICTRNIEQLMKSIEKNSRLLLYIIAKLGDMTPKELDRIVDSKEEFKEFVAKEVKIGKG